MAMKPTTLPIITMISGSRRLVRICTRFSTSVSYASATLSSMLSSCPLFSPIVIMCVTIGGKRPLRRSGKFPPIVTHMITIGEKSGQLEGMLESVANAYDTEVENRVQILTSLLEPLIIVAMGSVVGFIAVSILMPLIQMSSFAG